MVIDRSEVRKNVANEHEEKHGFSHLPSKKKSSAIKEKSSAIKQESSANKKTFLERSNRVYDTQQQ